MITVMYNHTNGITPWWKFYSSLKYVTFDEWGDIRDQFFSVGSEEISLPFINVEIGDHPLPNVLLFSSNLAHEQYLSFLVCGSRHFIVAIMLI